MESVQTQQNPIRVAVVDEPGLYRVSLARFLAAEPGFEVAGQCGASSEALELIESATPDVVLMDFEVGPDQATDLINTARLHGYEGRFLIVAGVPNPRKAALALKAAASGIFLKSEAPELLVQAIKVVAAGGVWVDPTVVKLLADQLVDQDPPFLAREPKSPEPLADRERDVLLGILDGRSNREIGEALGISESSVKNVVQRLFTKSGVKTRGQLVRAALEGSLGTPQEFNRSRTITRTISNRTRSTEPARLYSVRQTRD